MRRVPFYFLRHGQTDWNAERRLQGRTDIALNDVGTQQAAMAAEQLAGVAFASVCCSPLGRAVQTAEIVNRRSQRPMVMIDDLQECHFGTAEGRLIEGESFDDLVRHAERTGGESMTTFSRRVVNGVQQALAHPGPVLIVAHGGVFRAIQAALGISHGADMANCVPMLLAPSDASPAGWSITTVSGESPLNAGAATPLLA